MSRKGWQKEGWCFYFGPLFYLSGMDAIYLAIGIVLGWTLRYERDRKIFKRLGEEMEKIKTELRSMGVLK